MFLKYLDMQINKENKRLFVFSRLFAQTVYEYPTPCVSVSVLSITQTWRPWTWNTLPAAPVNVRAWKS